MTAAERIYLDYAATTPVRAEVIEAMLPFFGQNGYNASSIHAEGRAARAALDQARERVAACLHAKSKEIVFTGGGSEADNLAIIGAARALREKGRHVVSVATEHHAVLHSLEALRDEGWEVTLLAVDSDGAVSTEAFAAALRDDTVLASVMYVNNELGTVQSIAKLAQLAHARGALFHTDAVQAAAYLPIDAEALGVDMISLAAHKFYGPKGTGVLYVRDGTPIVPIIHGGSQEFAKRAGTENVAGIVGFATALDLASSERTDTAARIATLRSRFEHRILQNVPDVRVNGGALRAPHISNMSFLGVGSEQLLMRLDLEGIAVSAGSACASGAIEPSHVIAALGLPEPWMLGVIRFSLGRVTTQAQVDRAAEVLELAVADLRLVSRAPA
ncbi:MAG TPA: cysteine desulfurase family protein [Candidatus Baltobacteraceae bacterium]|nr:cysteine desulfurase family protein [Candidatus Baltobacteraceae bacterium]